MYTYAWYKYDDVDNFFCFSFQAQLVYYLVGSIVARSRGGVENYDVARILVERGAGGATETSLHVRSYDTADNI